MLERNLPSGSNEYHKNTSGSVAGFRGGILNPGPPGIRSRGAVHLKQFSIIFISTFTLSYIYKLFSFHFCAIVGMNIVNHPTARNVDNVKNFDIQSLPLHAPCSSFILLKERTNVAPGFSILIPGYYSKYTVEFIIRN